MLFCNILKTNHIFTLLYIFNFIFLKYDLYFRGSIILIFKFLYANIGFKNRVCFFNKCCLFFFIHYFFQSPVFETSKILTFCIIHRSTFFYSKVYSVIGKTVFFLLFNAIPSQKEFIAVKMIIKI